MGNVCKKNKKDIEVVNVITKKDLLKYLHLDWKGEIIIKKHHGSCIAEIELRFENNFQRLFLFGLVILIREISLLLKVTFHLKK